MSFPTSKRQRRDPPQEQTCGCCGNRITPTGAGSGWGMVQLVPCGCWFHLACHCEVVLGGERGACPDRWCGARVQASTVRPVPSGAHAELTTLPINVDAVSAAVSAESASTGASPIQTYL